MHNNTETREAKRLSWLKNVLINEINYVVKPLAGDASFRSYFRIHLSNGNTFILMDAPPEKENCEPFVKIDQILINYGLPAPKLFHYDLEAGFILLEDFGDTLLSNVVQNDPDHYYKQAIDTLVEMQKIPCAQWMKPYDPDFITMECERFDIWFCKGLLEHALDKKTQQRLTQLYNEFYRVAAQQPRTFVHRDYHSRNMLIRTDQSSLGIIDFQDAIQGPIVYDLVSLLKDCYVKWPQDRVVTWCRYAFEGMQLPSTISFEQFLMWFDYIGMQRHIKVLGIFARLYLRDGKSQYLQDIPRVMTYVREVSHRYEALQSYCDLFEQIEEKFMTLSLHA